MKAKLIFILFLFLAVVVFHPWFDFSKTLSSGDWPYLYKENIVEFKFPPQLPFLWIEPYHQITAKIGVEILSLPWEVTEKIFWFYPFLLISFFSSYKYVGFFLKKLDVDKDLDIFIFLGIIIYMFNTYILMVVGGGQMGVVMAYSLAPLVLYTLINFVYEKYISIKFLSIASLVSALQLMFDPRLFLLTIGIFLFYFIFTILHYGFKLKRVFSIILVLFSTITLNSFWIFSNVSYYQDTYAQVLEEPLAKFLSFATFANSISFLHPNWPDNIFGKVSFMKPEFLLIAIFAYSSLYFVNKKNRIYILFFVLIGLLGAFFAKGINPPFGDIYEFFSNLPGGGSFRDPTKFYLLISLSYSILIPFTVFFIYDFLSKKYINKKHFSILFLILIFGYFLVILRPALAGELRGTFIPISVPMDYVEFKDFLISDNESYNILWVPGTQRFAISLRDRKAAINAQEFFKTTNFVSIINKIKDQKTKKVLMDSNIKYIAVPYDSLGEIFITDRRYDEKIYKKFIFQLESSSYLNRVLDKNKKDKFGKIILFEVIR